MDLISQRHEYEMLKCDPSQVVPSEIHDRFKEFGEILEIDIKKPDYALVQFVDIKSVVKAMRGMSSEMIAGQRVRLGFGLSVATKCVWCDGVGAEVTEKMLQVHCIVTTQLVRCFNRLNHH